MTDKNFELIKNSRIHLPGLCAEVLVFARTEASFNKINLSLLPPPIDEDSRLLYATLEGYLQKHVNLFGAILALEKMGYREEWLMLSRTLFEVSVDANYLWNAVLKDEDPRPTLQKIRYSWAFNQVKLLKESKNLSDEQLEQMKKKIVRVPGLSPEGHKAIEFSRNFTGLDMLRRCEKTEVGPYYKPVFARLSRYAHGMTYDREMAFAEQKNPVNLEKMEVSEEALNLMHCALIVLIALKYLCVVTAREHDLIKANVLEEKLGSLFFPED